MGLLAGDLQELLLHVDEGLCAALQQEVTACAAGQSPTRSFTPCIRISCCCLPNSRSSFWPSMKLVDAIAGRFADDRGWAIIRIGKLLPQRVHDVFILAHGKIQKDTLRGEQALHSLLRPTRHDRYKG